MTVAGARHARADGSNASASVPLSQSASSSLNASFELLLSEELAITRLCAQLGQGPRGSSSGSASADAVGRDVRAIQARLAALERTLEQLRDRDLDQTATTEDQLQHEQHTIEKHATIVEDLHGTLRTSILRARAASERAAVSARHELLGTNDQAAMQRRQKQFSAASAAEKSGEFTRSLHRTRSMLSDEIARSSSALDTLTSSTRVLGDTGAEYHTYNKTVKIGSKIITKQLRRERTDKFLILVGLCFFTLVVCYIVNKRLTPFLFWWTHVFTSSKTPATTTPSVQYAPAQTAPHAHHPTHVHTSPPVPTTPPVTHTPPPLPITPVATPPEAVRRPDLPPPHQHQHDHIVPPVVPAPHGGATHQTGPHGGPPPSHGVLHGVPGAGPNGDSSLTYAERQELFRRQQQQELQRQQQYAAQAQVQYNNLNGGAVPPHTQQFGHVPQPGGQAPTPPPAQGIHAYDEPMYHQEHGHAHGHDHAHSHDDHGHHHH